MPANRDSFGWYIKNMIRRADYMAGTASDKGPSPDLWAGAPLLQVMLDPTQGFYYFNDFMDEIDVTSDDGWTLTKSNSTGTISGSETVQGGCFVITSVGAQEDDSLNAQLKNCLVKPDSGVKIWFETRVKMTDATQQFFLGLAGIDASLLASGVLDDVVDKCGFYHEAASTDNKISVATSRTTVESKSTDVAANVDGIFVKLGFYINGTTNIDFYVNGVLVKSHNTATTLPNAVMCLSLFAGYETAAGIMTIDWIRLVQEGGRA